MRRSVAAAAVLWAGVWAATAGGQGRAAAAQTGTLRPYEPLQTTSSTDGASSAAEPGSGLSGQIRAILSGPAASRAHWGMMVTGLDGSPIAAVDGGELFQPASTDAALNLLDTNGRDAWVMAGGMDPFDYRADAALIDAYTANGQPDKAKVERAYYLAKFQGLPGPAAALAQTKP